MNRVLSFFICAGLLFPSLAQAAPQKVGVVHHGKGQWELTVNNAPYFIKGVVYSFTVEG